MTRINIAAVRDAAIILLLAPVPLFPAWDFFRSYRLDVKANEAVAAQARAVDALLGSSLSLPNVHDGFGNPTVMPSTAVIWLADQNCAGCLDGFEEWNRMAMAIDRPAFLVMLTDSIPITDAEQLRALRNTTVLWGSRTTMYRYFGHSSDHIKLVIDDGIVVMANLRDGGQYCGWSFEAQVATLLVGSHADQIRKQPMPRGGRS